MFYTKHTEKEPLAGNKIVSIKDKQESEPQKKALEGETCVVFWHRLEQKGPGASARIHTSENKNKLGDTYTYSMYYSLYTSN